jgi:hypothetical protein
MIKTKAKLLFYSLISTIALSTYGVNCPPGYSISISGSGSGNCGSTDSFSVSTQNSWDTYSWSITPVAGTVLKAAVISSPNSASTDVTAYWLNDNESSSCSWKLKCKATIGDDIECEAETTINITIPETGGYIDIEPDYNIAPTTNAETNKYWVPQYGNVWQTGSLAPFIDPSLSDSIFFTKVDKHEKQHEKDVKNASFVSQYLSVAIFMQELDDLGLTSEATTTATTLADIWAEAYAIAGNLWDTYVDALEDEAYGVSDPEWPQVFYQSDSTGEM